jgi:hypothetical protein
MLRRLFVVALLVASTLTVAKADALKFYSNKKKTAQGEMVGSDYFLLTPDKYGGHLDRRIIRTGLIRIETAKDDHVTEFADLPFKVFCVDRSDRIKVEIGKSTYEVNPLSKIETDQPWVTLWFAVCMGM